MFEHFGLRDLFIGLWKRRIGVLVLTLVLAFVLGGATVLNAQSGGMSNEETKKEYSYSKICCFEDKSALVMNGTTGEIVSGFTKSELAGIYNDILNRNFVRQEVLEKLEEKYTEDEIMTVYENTYGVRLDRNKKIELEDFGKFFKTSVFADNICMEYYAVTSDEQFTKDLMDCYSEYISGSLSGLGGDISVTYIGEKYESWDAKENLSAKIYGNKLLSIIIVLVISLILSCICFVIRLAAKPVINRASDFENLGVHVIGEWKERKNNVQK